MSARDDSRVVRTAFIDARSNRCHSDRESVAASRELHLNFTLKRSLGLRDFIRASFIHQSPHGGYCRGVHPPEGRNDVGRRGTHRVRRTLGKYQTCRAQVDAFMTVGGG